MFDAIPDRLSVPIRRLTERRQIAVIDGMKCSIDFKYGPTIPGAFLPKVTFYDATGPVSHPVCSNFAVRAGIEAEISDCLLALILIWTWNFNYHPSLSSTESRAASPLSAKRRNSLILLNAAGIAGLLSIRKSLR
jgi:hypothetical protein